MNTSNNTDASGRRELDGMLRVVRENLPHERIVASDELRSMLDQRANVRPVARNRRAFLNWLTTSVFVACIVVAAAVFGLLRDTNQGATVSPISQTANGRGEERAASSRETTRDTQSAEMNDVTVRSSTGPVVLPGSDSRARESRVALSSDAAASYDAGTDKRPESFVPADVPTEQLHSLDDQVSSAAKQQDASDRTDASKLDIAALGYIELSAAEAERIGVTLRASSLVVHADDWYSATVSSRGQSGFEWQASIARFRAGGTWELMHGTDSNELKRFKLEFGIVRASCTARNLGAQAVPLPIAPVIVVDQRRTSIEDKGWSMMHFANAPSMRRDRDSASDNRMASVIDAAIDEVWARDFDPIRNRALIGRLVPVYFRLEGAEIAGTNLRMNAEVCLWYVPTKAFIEALPERYRSSLEREITTIAEVVRSNGNVEQACDRIAGRPSYLELCRVSSGAITGASVYPNPASDAATLSFHLKEDRIVSVTLHDLSGRYLNHIEQSENLHAGDRTIPVDLSKLNKGAYLVAVRSTQGEQAVARLIVH